MINIAGILPHAFRNRGACVVSTLLLRAVLNFAGLAALLPVLMLLFDPAAIGAGWIEALRHGLGIASEKVFALGVCAAVVVVVVAKNRLNIGLLRIEHNYIYDLYHTLSRQLYVTYHKRGLTFIKASNSSALARNVNVVCMAFAAGVVRPAATIVAETTLLVILFTTAAIYAPAAALLSIGVFVPTIWLYYALVRRRINRYGELENQAQHQKVRLTVETFQGHAQIEVNDAFEMMLDRFDRTTREIVRMRSSEATISMLPQAFTETALAIGLAALAAWSLRSGQQQAQLLFGIFAVVTLRLMPSVRSILAAWASIRYNRYSVDLLRDAFEARTQADDSTQPLPFECEIRVEGLRFRFDDQSPELFGGLTFRIGKGERIGIRGVSGVGKTTLINLLLGLYTPTEGTITIDGTPLRPQNRRPWHNRIGYVSQQLFLTEGSFAANVALGIPDAEVDPRRVVKALEAAQLGPLIGSLPQGIDTPIGECGCRLSGGQRQRIGIARALYRLADVLILDEATSELDSATEQLIARLVAERPGITLIVVAHAGSLLKECERILEIGK